MSNRQKEVGCMGRFVNPDNSAFQVILNSDIYVDKTELLAYTNKAAEYGPRNDLQQQTATLRKIDYCQYAHCVLQ